MSQYCSEVHAFEPNPAVRSNMEEKIEMNTISNIVVHDVGLGALDEELPYFQPTGSNKGTGSFVEGYSQNNEDRGILLRVVRGDPLISSMGLGKIDLVKIDVEGFEKNVLIGLKQTIEKHRPIIFLEYSEATRTSFNSLDEFMNLFPKGYKVMKISCNNSCCGIFNLPKCNLVSFDFQSPGVDLLVFPV